MNWAGGAAGIKSIVITLAFLFLFIVAVLLDLQYLYLMSVTLAILPLASYLLAYFWVARFSAERTHEETVTESAYVPVRLEVTLRGGLPQSSVKVAEVIPSALDPRLGAASGEAKPLTEWSGQAGARDYFIEPQMRGVYKLGPARLETTDPLGLFTFSAPLNITTELVVHPDPVPARDWAVGGEGMHGLRERDGKTRRGEGMDFHGVRPYREGDALRRVHWPTTARTGKLAVVEFERAYQQDITILLDLRRDIHRGEGRESTLEYAVKVAATLADRTHAAGGGVTLLTQQSRVQLSPRTGDPDAARFRLFDHLARVQADSDESLASAVRAHQQSDGTHWVLLTPSGDPQLTAFLTNRIRHGDSVRVYFFEPSSFEAQGANPDKSAHVTSPAVAGAELRVIEQDVHSPWKEGGRTLEYQLRETI